MGYRLITQEHSMGCAVACVASLLGISYRESLKKFKIDLANKPIFYFKEIVDILKNSGLHYKYGKVTSKTKGYLNISGTIVFIRRSEDYPVGHYLLKTKKGWMNPWGNYPNINPAKANYNSKLPGEAQWILYKE